MYLLENAPEDGRGVGFVIDDVRGGPAAVGHARHRLAQDARTDAVEGAHLRTRGTRPLVEGAN